MMSPDAIGFQWVKLEKQRTMTVNMGKMFAFYDQNRRGVKLWLKEKALNV
jgi:hypothetical protein